MRVVRFHEDAGVPDPDPPVVVRGSVVDQTFGERACVMPERAPGAGVEREGVVSGSDVHDSVDHHRRDLQGVGIGRVKHPPRAKPVDVRGRDLVERRVTPARVVPVVRRPVVTGRSPNQRLRRDVHVGRNRALAVPFASLRTGLPARENHGEPDRAQSDEPDERNEPKGRNQPDGPQGPQAPGEHNRPRVVGVCSGAL